MYFPPTGSAIPPVGERAEEVPERRGGGGGGRQEGGEEGAAAHRLAVGAGAVLVSNQSCEYDIN